MFLEGWLNHKFQWRTLVFAMLTLFLSACGDGEHKTKPPAADAGVDQKVVQNSMVKLAGQAGESADLVDKTKLKYNWSFRSRPSHSTSELQNSNSSNASFLADVPGQYLVELIIGIDLLSGDPDLVNVDVASIKGAPVAHAGRDRVGTVCSPIRLDGSTGKSGKKKLQYDWKIVNKPPESEASLRKDKTAKPIFFPDKQGEYEIGLVVDTGKIKSAVDITRIMVNADVSVGLMRKGSCKEVYSFELVRGQLRPSQFSLMSAGLSAKIKKFSYLRGNYVKKGYRILEFDCRIERTEKKSAEEKLSVAKKKLSINKRLRQLNNISELELSLSQSEYAIAQEDLKKTEAIVSECVVRAPFSGIITEKHVQAHQHVNKGEPLFKLVNTKSLEVEMLISSSWLKRIGPKAVFTITLDEVGKPIDARIDRVVGTIDPVSQTVRVIGRLINPPKNLLPGMSGQVKFPDWS